VFPFQLPFQISEIESPFQFTTTTTPKFTMLKPYIPLNPFLLLYSAIIFLVAEPAIILSLGKNFIYKIISVFP
jgi:hypothetical protein